MERHLEWNFGTMHMDAIVARLLFLYTSTMVRAQRVQVMSSSAAVAPEAVPWAKRPLGNLMLLR